MSNPAVSSTAQRTDAGIVLELHDQKEGSVADYAIVGNVATVPDDIRGDRAIISGNLP